jgi:hypothetical protein
MARLTLIALFVTAAAFVSACGGDDAVTASENQAAGQAQSLAVQLRDIERSVRGDVAALDDGDAARAKAQQALRVAERRAREVARAARRRLPKDDPARVQLQRAALSVAAAAAMPADDPATARKALDDARDHLGKAAGTLEDRVPKPARKSVDDLRKSLENGS